jgi:hypothetical protein
MENLVKKLKQRNYNAIQFDSKKEARDYLISKFKDKDIIAWGGSVTINELGIKAEIEKRGIKTLDRDKARTPGEKRKIHLDSFDCDSYLMSTNAITEDGLLINIDGFGNRLANLIFGPKNVYVIAGKNKICKSEQDAIERVRHYAAPRNAKRLGLNTPCTETGECQDCLSEQCICNQIVISRRSWIKDRVNIILINEDLGI